MSDDTDALSWEFNCPQYVDFASNPPKTPARPEPKKVGDNDNCEQWFTPSAETPAPLKKKNVPSKKSVSIEAGPLPSLSRNVNLPSTLKKQSKSEEMVKKLRATPVNKKILASNVMPSTCKKQHSKSEEQIKKFKATPVNRKILETNSIVCGVPKVQKAKITKTREFRFQTDERIRVRKLRLGLI